MYQERFFVPPPKSEQVLYERAVLLAGQKLSTVAQRTGLTMPIDLRRHKGWVGILIERAIGACSGNKSQQDFPELGIELKTIPVTEWCKPLESTFVCTAPLIGQQLLRWEESTVALKLQRVLWIPIEGARQIPLAERCIGTPFLWSPTIAELQQLRQDWEELMDCIVLGEVERITAYQGQVLQLRPKAAHSRVVTPAVGNNGTPIRTLPLGFYLRTTFTSCLLADYFFAYARE